MNKPFYMMTNKTQLIRHFTPNWFTVNMGTGVVALITSELPFLHSQLFSFGTALWLFNTILFILFSIIYALRWILFYNEAKLILKHSSMLFFLGAIPMALATIINGCLKYGIVLLGDQLIVVAKNLWYLDALLAVFVSFFVPAMMFTRQDHKLNSMTALWLLPIVAAEVTASSGGILLNYAMNPHQAFTILIASYVLWGISVLPAFSILSILFLRLAIHKLPEEQMAISGCLALGPIGTGAFALLLLGKQSIHILQAAHLTELGVVMHSIGIVGSLILIGFGMWWLAIAVFTIYKKFSANFHLGWWGLTFPLGVYTFSILELAKQLNLVSMAYIGYSLSILLIGLWLFVIIKTLLGAYKGSLFISPCLIAEKKLAH
ncbi:TDT family transporter [Acinetobacter nectaris]|uniref:TDT family transporter n=1 Tax=Acinetobacter nectaris TaxID=1219382 RepID=UPI001F4445FC|nr:TDT family transporter [Acinetobacter nectaris]MCF9047120.1 TDT family transporter [Acinetobacter nectaris]